MSARASVRCWTAITTGSSVSSSAGAYDDISRVAAHAATNSPRSRSFGGWLRAAVGDAPEPDLWDAIAQRLPTRRPAPERSRARSVPSRRRGLPGLAVAAAAAAFAGAFLVTTSDSGRLASLGGASGVVRSIYANKRPVMVLEAESSNDSTIIWLMDELGEQSPEVSESVGI